MRRGKEGWCNCVVALRGGEKGSGGERRPDAVGFQVERQLGGTQNWKLDFHSYKRVRVSVKKYYMDIFI